VPIEWKYTITMLLVKNATSKCAYRMKVNFSPSVIAEVDDDDVDDKKIHAQQHIHIDDRMQRFVITNCTVQYELSFYHFTPDSLLAMRRES